MKVATGEQSNHGYWSSLSLWWQRLAYKNKFAEWSLYFLFITGFLLWDPIPTPWAVERLILLTHSISSLLLFPLFIAPFWTSHRRLLHRSNKKFLRFTGQIIDGLLLTSLISGLYLLLVGNPGENAGAIAHLIHLITALILAPLLIKHAGNWSVLKPLWSLFKKDK